MSEKDQYAFETYPRAELSMPISRRQAITLTLTESQVRDGQSRGGNAFRLSSLGTLPDDLLALLTPQPVPGCQVIQEGALLEAQIPGRNRPIVLFPADSPAATVLSRFDGRTRLEVMGRDLAAQCEWDDTRGFAYVRGVFLHLITLGVCSPT